MTFGCFVQHWYYCFRECVELNGLRRTSLHQVFIAVWWGFWQESRNIKKVCLNRTIRKNKTTLEGRWLWRQNSNIYGSNTTAGPTSRLVFSSRETQLRRRLKKKEKKKKKRDPIFALSEEDHGNDDGASWVWGCVYTTGGLRSVCVCVCVSEPLKSASQWRSERRAEQQRRPHSAHLHHQAEPPPTSPPASMKRIISFYLFIVLSRRDKNWTTSHFFFLRSFICVFCWGYHLESNRVKKRKNKTQEKT